MSTQPHPPCNDFENIFSHTVSYKWMGRPLRFYLRWLRFYLFVLQILPAMVFSVILWIAAFALIPSQAGKTYQLLLKTPLLAFSIRNPS